MSLEAFGVKLPRLLSLIEAADTTHHRVGRHDMIQIEIPWIGSGKPMDIFKDLADDWRVFWQGKEERVCYVAAGSLVDSFGIQDLSELSSSHKIRVFGGIPFQSVTAPANEKEEDHSSWGAFSSSKFFIPICEWSFDNAPMLKIRILKANLNTDGSMAKQCCQQLLNLCASSHHAKGSVETTPPFRARYIQEMPIKSDWVESVDVIKKAIASQRVSKVVLSRCKKIDLDQAVPAVSFLKALARLHEPSYLFCFVAPSGEAFIGRSPERILAWRDQVVFADAIAGTRHRRSDSIADSCEATNLKSSSKDSVEHLNVTDYVEKTLAEHCKTFTRYEDKALLKLHYVQHMISSYSGLLHHGTSALDLLQSLHPTPAVAGTPKLDATRLLSRLEPMDRGWFSGSVGWFDGSAGDFAIGIRSALLCDSELTIFAGAGIVLESDPVEEWEETEVKMRNFTDIVLATHSRSKSDEFHGFL